MATPGCSSSVVPKTVWHSCALSMRYFSLKVKIPMISPWYSSAMSSPGFSVSAVAVSVDRVIGMGQNTPALSPVVKCILSHTLCQSAWFIKPSSGVKPPIPSIIKSPASRELIWIFGRFLAFCWAAVSASPLSNFSFNVSLPCGGTSWLREWRVEVALWLIGFPILAGQN